MLNQTITSRAGRVAAVVVLGAIALGLASCAAVLGAIEDRLPPPAEVDEGILFRFNSPSARQVTLAGSFNSWGGTETGRYIPEIDPMTDPDGDGVWTIVKALPPGRYEYKFVLDGAVRWEADPTNPETVDDSYGGVNSVLVVPPTVGYEYEAVTGTVIEETRTERAEEPRETEVERPAPTADAAAQSVEFEVDLPEATEVYVAGDFNGWEPTEHRLERGDDGLFRVTLEIPPGVYEYKFIVDGTWVADPDNPETAPDPYGGVNSLLTVE
jgi:1,4-alpha-glucan branching enzyme